MSTQPGVGRVVHYVSHGSPVREDGTQAYTSQCRAAIVTEVQRDRAALRDGADHEIERREQESGAIGLCVLNPNGQFFDRGVKYDDGGETTEHLTELCTGMTHAGGTWHWPARI